MDRGRALVLTAASVLAAGVASAQDFKLVPSFGEVTLNAGFTPDPHSIAIVGGGAINASEALGVDSLGNSCVGMIASAPDYRVLYGAGDFPLILSVTATDDTTLVINDPLGNWHCDDDSGGKLNPAIEFTSPVSGQYDIWVGAFAGGDPDATLNISEITGNVTVNGPAPSDDIAVDQALTAVISQMVALVFREETAEARALIVECLFKATADLPSAERQMLIDVQFGPNDEQIARMEQLQPGISELVEACGL